MSNQTDEVTRLKAENDALKLALDRAENGKVESDFFVDKEGNTLKYKSLSETKKYFEAKQPELLATLLKDAKVSSKAFHEILVAAIKSE